MVALAFALDLLVGDPAFLTKLHPVVLLGRFIALLESYLYRQRSKVRGALLTTIVCVAAYLGTKLLMYIAGPLQPLAEIWLLCTALAARGLYDAGMKIYHALKIGDITEARLYTGEIVGRDTYSLSRTEVVRAAVESVAENTVDGVTAPIFYALIGGAPLAIMYKAINTMDSMIGHNDERYTHFGWAAAKLDDFANYLPARLTALTLVLATNLLGLDAAGAWHTMLRDARKHRSPNAGIPEAGVAGALGVQLGGINHYGGIGYETARLGSNTRELEEEDIRKTCQLMLLTSVIFLAAGFVLVLSF
jgi:adenosylcobinamide-phosphate synthase